MFQENLKRLVQSTEGGVAGLLMGFDGIAVDSFTVQDAGVDITTVGMEFSFILTQVRKAAEILEVGGVQEIAIRAEKLTVLIASEIGLDVVVNRSPIPSVRHDAGPTEPNALLIIDPRQQRSKFSGNAWSRFLL